MMMKAIALVVTGVIGAVVTVALYGVDPVSTAIAICATWWLVLTVAIGALGMIMTINLARATWFVGFRPSADAIARTLPVLSLLGVLPAMLVAHHVYVWAGADTSHLPHDVVERIARTQPWMSPWPVALRTILSLGVLSTFAILRLKSTKASAIGLVLLAIAMTVTPFDWMMRIEPGWTSTIYGMYVAIAGFYGASGLVAIFAWRELGRGERHRRRLLKPDHLHALGRIMLTAVCLWGYLGFFQFMLQWIGNLPAEVVFYERRSTGPWMAVSFVLVLAHFVVPFFMLLSRPLKRSATGIGVVGVIMVSAHVIDVAWLLFPSSRMAGDRALLFSLAPLAAFVGFGAAWTLWRGKRTTSSAEAISTRAAMRYESP